MPKPTSINIHPIPFSPSRLSIPPSPFSPLSPLDPLPRAFVAAPPSPTTSISPKTPKITRFRTLPPPLPLHWLWQCHLCNQTYALGVTRRCLEDGHFFCSGVAYTTAKRGLGARKRPKKSRACASEFDYAGWAAWGAWRRKERELALAAKGLSEAKSSPTELLQQRRRSSDKINVPRAGTLRSGVLNKPSNEKDCWRTCDYPSQCRWGRQPLPTPPPLPSAPEVPGLEIPSLPSTPEERSPDSAEPQSPPRTFEDILSGAGRPATSPTIDQRIAPMSLDETTSISSLLFPVLGSEPNVPSSSSTKGKDDFWSCLLDSALWRRGRPDKDERCLEDFAIASESNKRASRAGEGLKLVQAAGDASDEAGDSATGDGETGNGSSFFEDDSSDDEEAVPESGKIWTDPDVDEEVDEQSRRADGDIYMSG